jgi:hypothetical protein
VFTSDGSISKLSLARPALKIGKTCLCDVSEGFFGGLIQVPGSHWRAEVIFQRLVVEAQGSVIISHRDGGKRMEVAQGCTRSAWRQCKQFIQERGRDVEWHSIMVRADIWHKMYAMKQPFQNGDVNF